MGIEDNVLARAVRRARKGNEYTQKELASMMECSLNTLKLIESGKRKPNINFCNNFLKVFGINLVGIGSENEE